MAFKNLLEHKPDYLVCVCMNVMYSEIIAAMDRGDRTFKELQNSLMVGAGCSSCHDELAEIIAAYTKKDS
jgi:bacterioferritin-associated ferredoxin